MLLSVIITVTRVLPGPVFQLKTQLHAQSSSLLHELQRYSPLRIALCRSEPHWDAEFSRVRTHSLQSCFSVLLCCLLDLLLPPHHLLSVSRLNRETRRRGDEETRRRCASRADVSSALLWQICPHFCFSGCRSPVHCQPGTRRHGDGTCAILQRWLPCSSQLE